MDLLVDLFGYLSIVVLVFLQYLLAKRPVGIIMAFFWWKDASPKTFRNLLSGLVSE